MNRMRGSGVALDEANKAGRRRYAEECDTLIPGFIAVGRSHSVPGQ